MSTSKKSYFQLVKEAIVALKDRSGSSTQAIKGWITATYPTLAFAQHHLRAALKKGETESKLIKNKNSFKLAPSEKKPEKKKVAEKPASAPKAKATSVAKKATTKEPVAKKAKEATAKVTAKPKKTAPVKAPATPKKVTASPKKVAAAKPVKSPKKVAAKAKTPTKKSTVKKVGAKPKSTTTKKAVKSKK